jgi:hypothetical protein
MKTNKMMRIASVLLVAVLLTTCVISGTFAKYVTTTSVTDSARVAYWGFVEPASTTFNLFDHGETTIFDGTGANAKLIAPGTSGSATFAMAYTNYTGDTIKAPEVPYSFTVDVTVNDAANYEDLDANENFVWTLDGVAVADADADGLNEVSDLVAAIKALSGDVSGTKNYEAKTLPAAFAVGTSHTIGWNWEYYVDAAGDEFDTAMGNAGALDNIEITITITAEQIN